MRPLLVGIAALATVSVTSSSLIVEACGQERRPAARAASKPTVTFREDVFPIFKGRCLDCHTAGGQGVEKSGLDLSTYEGLMKGTKFGPMVIPGDPGSSNLMWLLDWRGSPQTRMPHGSKKLSTCDRDAIRSWIASGAKND